MFAQKQRFEKARRWRDIVAPSPADDRRRLMQTTARYLDYSGREDVLSGGVKMVPIRTPKGGFKVWTKRVGNNPEARVLLLHGGPAATHEYWEACDSYLPAAGIEYIYYDQLGSAYSDQPDDPDLWSIERFVDEVEQVRDSLDLNRDNFYLVGHSWGGVLAIEYALRFQQHLKGLVISNMMASIPAYNAYANSVLKPGMDQEALAEIEKMEAAGEFSDPRYMKLLMQHHYVNHVLRMPLDEWPDPVNRAFAKLNYPVYLLMQGPSELGASGRLVDWDRTADLERIKVPALVIGSTYDTMDPKHLQMMAGRLPKGRFHLCPRGSHMAMYDDQQTYFQGVIGFIREVERGSA
jgi:proline iminopeptidase